jgi:hypothetical protein
MTGTGFGAQVSRYRTALIALIAVSIAGCVPSPSDYPFPQDWISLRVPGLWIEVRPDGSATVAGLPPLPDTCPSDAWWFVGEGQWRPRSPGSIVIESKEGDGALLLFADSILGQRRWSSSVAALCGPASEDGEFLELVG